MIKQKKKEKRKHFVRIKHYLQNDFSELFTKADDLCQKELKVGHLQPVYKRDPSQKT